MPAIDKGFSSISVTRTSPERAADVLAACGLFKVPVGKKGHRGFLIVEFYRAAEELLLRSLREGKYKPPPDRPGEKPLVAVRKQVADSWDPIAGEGGVAWSMTDGRWFVR